MVMVCRQEYLGYEDDFGNKQYETVCEDDGTENPDNSGGGDGGDDTAGGDDYVSPYYTNNFTWGKAPDEEGSDTVVDPKTGNITYQYDDGSSLTVDRNGNPVSNTESPDA
jgi:hypothetical protein